jgi:ankyrin repeat protein
MSEPDNRTVLRVLQLIQERVLDQFRMRDDNGSLPLHIAMRNSHARRNQVLTHDYPSKLISFLLNEFPESISIPDGQGRLPLHIAVEHGLPCYDILVNADSRALTT